MILTIQSTGHIPLTFECDRSFTSVEMLEGDKRGVRVTAYMTDRVVVAGEVEYITSWGIERNYTLAWVTMSPHRDLESFADSVRVIAKNIMPPGAGFPATPQFETRQAKLKGMMETLTLSALTKVLRDAAS